jgi:O-antigen ligase/tetratricopeptide (TPR) repeat protein
MKSLLKNIILVCLFALPFVALYVANSSFFPYITGKNFLFRMLVEVAFAAWIPLMLRFREFRPKKSIILWGFLGFVVTMLISAILAVNPEKAIWSNFERMEGYITLIHLFALYLVASSVVTKLQIWERFFDATLIAGVFVAVSAFTKTTNWDRIDGPLGNATYFAAVMLFCLFFALYMIVRRLREGKTWFLYLYVPAIITFLVGLYYAGTRGTILGFIGGLGITALILAFMEKKAPALKLVARIAIVIGVVGILGFIAIKDTSFVRSSPVMVRFSSISAQDNTTKARFMVWGEALQGFKERPLFGWGQENFNYVFNKYYNPGMYGQEQWFDRTHNVVLDWLVTGGIFGLAGYLFLFGSSLWFLFRGKVPFEAEQSKKIFSTDNNTEQFIVEKSIFIGLFVAYFIHNLFVFDNITSWIPFIMLVSFISALWVKGDTFANSSELETSDSFTQSVVIPGVIVVFVFVAYFSVWKGAVAAQTLVQAMRYGQDVPNSKGEVVQRADIGKTFDAFKKVIALNTFANSEAREYLVQAVSIVESRGKIDERVAFREFARDQMKKQIAETPNDARYHMFAASLSSAYGQFDDAEKSLKRAIELSPRKQSLLYQLAQVYLQEKKYDDAVAVYKEAYLAYPINVTAMEYYAAGLVFAGRVAESDSFIDENKNVFSSQGVEVVSVGGKSYLLGEKILAVYVEKGLVDKVDAALRAGISVTKDGNKAVLYYKKLVGTYMKVNKNDKAASVVQELIQAFPNNPENAMWKQGLAELRSIKK